MKKEKLIEELQKIPDGIEVCVFDWRKNLNNDCGDGSSVGIYPDFKVELMVDDFIPKGGAPWVGLNVENDDYDENGLFINND